MLRPGSALDLGCGSGGDAIWLALHGWQVTAVDISAAATRQLAARAAAHGVRELVVAERHDLARSFPSGRFDLISAQYLHSPHLIPRPQIFRAAADALRCGGVLLIVDHGSTAPWSWNQDPDAHYPAPLEVAASLDLDPDRWTIARADMPTRRASGPNDEAATVIDNVLVITRASG